MSGSILVISGPSGAGKSSLLKKVYQEIDNYYFSISTTTRAPREGEVDGKDYFFIQEKEFLEDIKNDYFLEWAEVHGNYYGTSLRPVNEALAEGKLVIFDVDIQGFKSIKQKLGHLVTSVFITTPNINVLEERLKKRNTDSAEVIEKRIINAIGEMEYIEQYNSIIINDDLESSFLELLSIVNYAQTKSHIDAAAFKIEWKKR